MTAGGSYGMWISWIKLEMRGRSTKKSHSLGATFFGVFSKDFHTFLGSHLQWPSVFQNFRGKPRNLVEYLLRHFINHPACFFLEKTIDRHPACFFLEKNIDRQIDLLFWMLRDPANYTDLELLSEPPQNKMCYILHIRLSPASQ